MNKTNEAKDKGIQTYGWLTDNTRVSRWFGGVGDANACDQITITVFGEPNRIITGNMEIEREYDIDLEEIHDLIQNLKSALESEWREKHNNELIH